MKELEIINGVLVTYRKNKTYRQAPLKSITVRELTEYLSSYDMNYTDRVKLEYQLEFRKKIGLLFE